MQNCCTLVGADHTTQYLKGRKIWSLQFDQMAKLGVEEVLVIESFIILDVRSSARLDQSAEVSCVKAP